MEREIRAPLDASGAEISKKLLDAAESLFDLVNLPFTIVNVQVRIG